jgi:hypothetical protein
MTLPQSNVQLGHRRGSRSIDVGGGTSIAAFLAQQSQIINDNAANNGTAATAVAIGNTIGGSGTSPSLLAAAGDAQRQAAQEHAWKMLGNSGPMPPNALAGVSMSRLAQLGQSPPPHLRRTSNSYTRLPGLTQVSTNSNPNNNNGDTNGSGNNGGGSDNGTPVSRRNTLREPGQLQQIRGVLRGHSGSRLPLASPRHMNSLAKDRDTNNGSPTPIGSSTPISNTNTPDKTVNTNHTNGGIANTSHIPPPSSSGEGEYRSVLVVTEAPSLGSQMSGNEGIPSNGIQVPHHVHANSVSTMMLSPSNNHGNGMNPPSPLGTSYDISSPTAASMGSSLELPNTVTLSSILSTATKEMIAATLGMKSQSDNTNITSLRRAGGSPLNSGINTFLTVSTASTTTSSTMLALGGGQSPTLNISPASSPPVMFHHPQAFASPQPLSILPQQSAVVSSSSSSTLIALPGQSTSPPQAKRSSLSTISPSRRQSMGRAPPSPIPEIGPGGGGGGGFHLVGSGKRRSPSSRKDNGSQRFNWPSPPSNGNVSSSSASTNIVTNVIPPSNTSPSTPNSPPQDASIRLSPSLLAPLPLAAASFVSIASISSASAPSSTNNSPALTLLEPNDDRSITPLQITGVASTITNDTVSTATISLPTNRASPPFNLIGNVHGGLPAPSRLSPVFASSGSGRTLLGPLIINASTPTPTTPPYSSLHINGDHV